MKNPITFDPGTGLSSSDKQQRIMSKDGSFNVSHINRKIKFSDIYGYLLHTSWGKFILLIAGGYIGFNIAFATVYFMIGVDSLGVESSGFINDYLHSFFFSTQTFTTIGYGFLAPKTIGASSLSAIEGFVGLLFFAFASGLFYGRFSKPKPNLVFSKNFIFKPHNDQSAIMFRLMHQNTNVAMNMHAECILAIKKDEQSKTLYTYHNLKLERERILMMPYTWTVVHTLDEKSPLYGIPKENLKHLDAEFMILVRYFDDTFSQDIYQRHSYTFDELEIEKTFIPSFGYNDQGEGILNHDLLHSIQGI